MGARETRTRSGAEVAFIVMKCLAAARLLWSNGGALPLDVLPGLVPASGPAIALAVQRLRAEGIVEVSGNNVRLSEHGAREICARGGAVVHLQSTTTAPGQLTLLWPKHFNAETQRRRGRRRNLGGGAQ
jgi:hypothetical protein